MKFLVVGDIMCDTYVFGHVSGVSPEAQALLVTRGEAGMSLFQPAEAPQHLSTLTRDVFDVTGAGDTVIAAFAAAAVGGLSYAEAAWVANVAAGIVVGKAGTAVVHRDELEAQLPKRMGQTWRSNHGRE